MDIGAISAAYEGLKIAKNAITGLADLKIETEALSRINEAVKKVGEAQDTLFALLEELFRLQEENNRLKQALSQQEEWISASLTMSSLKQPAVPLYSGQEREPRISLALVAWRRRKFISSKTERCGPERSIVLGATRVFP